MAGGSTRENPISMEGVRNHNSTLSKNLLMVSLGLSFFKQEVCEGNYGLLLAGQGWIKLLFDQLIANWLQLTYVYLFIFTLGG